jgi:hypothetical protein
MSFIFTVTRDNTIEAANPLTVDILVGGTATFGVDYTVSGALSFTTTAASVLIPANALSANIVVTPIADTASEVNETVILTIVPVAEVSQLGVNSVATATIVSDDALPLNYVSDGDANGLFYWMGTSGGTASWTNPFPLLTYTVNPSGLYDNLPTMTNRIVNGHPDNTWISGPWMTVDIGANLRIRPSYVSLRSWINASRYPRNFKIQGSNNGTTFDDLLTVVNNTTITAASQWLSLPITMPTTGYRYLRYLCTSPGSSQGVVEVVLGEWEFYGEVSQI